MTSAIIGRMACPDCGFESAHVKQSDKCLFRYCPECHTQTFAKTELQQANMRQRMRPVQAVAQPAPVEKAPTSGSGAPPPPAAPPKHPAPKRSPLFGW